MSDDARTPDDRPDRRPDEQPDERPGTRRDRQPEGQPDRRPGERSEQTPERTPVERPAGRPAELPPEAPRSPQDAPAPAGEPRGADIGDGPPEEDTGVSGGDGRTGRQRLVAAVWPPRMTRAQIIVAVLLFVLGLGLAIQVRSTSESSPLRGARQEDLVRILDELDDRSARLEDERERLEDQRRELENSSDQAEEARRQTRQKQQQLGVLAGTVAAEGPGLHITVLDPSGAVEADMLLDTIQELRAAGAEAIEINDVRVVAGTYFTDQGGRVRIDGHRVSQPFNFEVIGEPKDLEPALNIPGGVVQTLEKEQATVEVTRSEKIVVDALRSAKRPDYARSSQ
ncbi:DUF881 domain-containing protein [Streptomyces sp. JJ36]|uniref:DUF881 domain-containing protein n=1 Tax=Streptomyces sp. JJ36 TaxID=2736645 RepID=UPI001F4875E9|nr:DUF881 domain-containing protein [Streptomyces sp. JJ36]MCF6524316.1 DUF881 domain-containing protein [Streptomyces sp. JJ36]